MIEYNQKENQLKITIPLSGIEELQSYQNAVLGVIRQFEIEDCDPELMGYIMLVYKLLGHIMLDEEFFYQTGKIAPALKDLAIIDPKQNTKKS